MGLQSVTRVATTTLRLKQYVHMGIPRYELNIDDIRSPYSGKKGSPTSRSVSQWCQNSDLTVMSEQSYILVSDVRTLIII